MTGKNVIIAVIIVIILSVSVFLSYTYYADVKAMSSIEVTVNDVELIYDRLLEIYEIAENQNIATSDAADKFAEKRIAVIKEIRSNYIKR